jgi:hypothetical protein
VARAKEKDYAAIAASKIYRPSTVQLMPKFLIYGRNKKGKTTFGNSAGVDRTLTFDTEWGTKEMKTTDPHVWPIDKWEDMEDAFEFVRNLNECQACTPHHSFRWICVDGLTKLSNMSLRYVMQVQEARSLDRIPGMVQQRDYGKSGELMKEMMTKFHNLKDVGVIFTAQERMQEAADSEEDEDYDEGGVMFVPDLPKGVRSMANSIVDAIGRIYVVKVDDKPQRRLWIADSVKYDTGYRSDHQLPDYLRNPTVPRLVKLIREGTLSSKKKTA